MDQAAHVGVIERLPPHKPHGVHAQATQQHRQNHLVLSRFVIMSNSVTVPPLDESVQCWAEVDIINSCHSSPLLAAAVPRAAWMVAGQHGCGDQDGCEVAGRSSVDFDEGEECGRMLRGEMRREGQGRRAAARVWRIRSKVRTARLGINHASAHL